MDASKLVMGVVGLAVIIMMLTVIVIPAVENAQSEQRTLENNSSARYIAIQSNTDTTFAVVDSAPCINGVALSSIIGAPVPTGTASVWAISDNWMVRADYSSETGWGSSWALSYENSQGAGTSMVLDDESLVCSNGTADVMAEGVSTLSLSYTYLLIPSKNGDYVEYNKGLAGGVYVDTGKTIYVASSTYNSTWVLAHGTLDNISVDKGFVSGVATPITITATYAPTEDGASNYLTALTTSGEINLTNAAGVLVPLKYSVISDQDQSMISLFGLIPLLLIIVAVLYAVRLMGTSRN